jgi:hypothetical protein
MAHEDRDDEREHERNRDRGGPEGTGFLDLEQSKVLFDAADDMTRDAARELMREAIKERLRARIGDKLKALGELAADMLVEDIEANLAVEEAIERRKEGRATLEARVRAIFTAKKKK